MNRNEKWCFAETVSVNEWWQLVVLRHEHAAFGPAKITNTGETDAPLRSLVATEFKCELLADFTNLSPLVCERASNSGSSIMGRAGGLGGPEQLVTCHLSFSHRNRSRATQRTLNISVGKTILVEGFDR
jgi:hypothetical protein